MKSISIAPEQGAGPYPVAKRGCCYVEPPPSTMEVMQEQMQYLFAHASSACPPGCAECARLDQVRRCLLRPFD